MHEEETHLLLGAIILLSSTCSTVCILHQNATRKTSAAEPTKAEPPAPPTLFVEALPSSRACPRFDSHFLAGSLPSYSGPLCL